MPNLYASLFYSGDETQAVTSPRVNATEVQLIERLRKISGHGTCSQHSGNCRFGGDSIKSADEIEALLIEEMRRLGHATLETLAGRAEQTW